MKVIIIGGVAGGASAAAKLRRLDEKAEIILLERGEYISFANCGLPYHVGKVIKQRDNLLVMTPEKFRARTNIDVRIRNEVIEIDRERKVLKIRRTDSGEIYEENYDKLILSTGSSPVRPPIPGANDRDVMQLWTIPDMDGIISRLNTGIKSAVVVGGGFIGLEVAENLRERGLDVHLVEMLPQVLPPLDAEMAQPLALELERHGIHLHLERRVEAIERISDAEVS
ncbi:MAG: pyridine nucleotide-disulfide oxidoreductase, partial [Lentisphaerae bacterium]